MTNEDHFSREELGLIESFRKRFINYVIHQIGISGSLEPNNRPLIDFFMDENHEFKDNILIQHLIHLALVYHGNQNDIYIGTQIMSPDKSLDPIFISEFRKRADELARNSQSES
jgi:hypothetical protein